MTANATIELPSSPPTLYSFPFISSSNKLSWSSNVSVQPSAENSLQVATPSTVTNNSFALSVSNNATSGVGTAIIATANANAGSFALQANGDVLQTSVYQSKASYNLANSIAVTAGNNNDIDTLRESTIFITGNVTASITGLLPQNNKGASVYNRRLTIIYAGTGTITFVNASTASAVANRFAIRSAQNLVSAGAFVAIFEYSSSEQRWIDISFRSRVPVGANYTQTGSNVTAAGATYTQAYAQAQSTSINACRTDIGQIITRLNNVMTTLRNNGIG
jgi:hypothetical protein